MLQCLRVHSARPPPIKYDRGDGFVEEDGNALDPWLILWMWEAPENENTYFELMDRQLVFRQLPRLELTPKHPPLGNGVEARQLRQLWQ